MTKAEQPTRTITGSVHDDYVENHPAYAQIAASRVSSTPGHHLYGSDFQHQHFMTIAIRRSQMRRSISNDWPSASEELIEVALSEAQWATFVSATNMGFGTPCTITWLNGYLPGISPIEDRREQFTREVDERLQKAVSQAIAIRDTAKTKAQREIAQLLISTLTDGLPWVAKQFDEHAEKTIEKMKIEVEAYLTSAVHRAGLEALGAPLPVLLEDPADEG